MAEKSRIFRCRLQEDVNRLQNLRLKASTMGIQFGYKQSQKNRLKFVALAINGPMISTHTQRGPYSTSRLSSGRSQGNQWFRGMPHLQLGIASYQQLSEALRYPSIHKGLRKLLTHPSGALGRLTIPQRHKRIHRPKEFPPGRCSLQEKDEKSRFKIHSGTAG